jgi:ribosomal protein L37AE/L43A
MKAPSRTTSRPHYLVCPTCGSGELRPRGPELADCDSCGLSVEGAVFRTLEQIATLPDARGTHACECGHPEMRRLPDGVFHCPACGSEVLPLKARRSLPGNPLGSTGDSTVFPAGDAGGTVRELS